MAELAMKNEPFNLDYILGKNTKEVRYVGNA